VIKSLAERAPNRAYALDAHDKAEISILIEEIADLVDSYPFGPE
jgi:hypothetical protein